MTQALTSSEMSTLPVFILCVCCVPAVLSFQDLYLVLFFSGSFVLPLLKNLCQTFFPFLFKAFVGSIVMSSRLTPQESGGWEGLVVGRLALSTWGRVGVLRGRVAVSVSS